MKQLIFFFFLLIGLTSSAQSIVWLDSMEVADGQFGYVRPRISLSKEGNPQILMARGGSGKLYFSQWDGQGFTAPIQLTDSLDETYIANWTGPDMESHGDTIVAVFKLMPYDTGKVYAVRSTDGGLTFSSKLRVDSHNGGMVWMPSMNMDGSGNPVITYMAHDANYANPHYVIVRSLDGGASYENEEFVTGGVPGEACDCCPSEIATDGNQKILLYRNNESNIRDIYAVVSDAQGSAFSSHVNVDNNAWPIQSCPSTGPHGIIDDTTLYTAFVTGASGAYRIVLSRTSLSSNATYIDDFSVPAPVNQNGTQNFPRIAIENGILVMAWTEAENSNFEVFTSWAPLSNLGELMNHKQLVNSISNGVQTNPDVRLSNGYIHLVYQDNYQARTIYKRGLIGYVGLDEVDSKLPVWYPNPGIADEPTVIPMAYQETAFQVINQLGQVVYQHDLEKSTIPTLVAGTYIIKLESVETIKWVIR